MEAPVSTVLLIANKDTRLCLGANAPSRRSLGIMTCAWHPKGLRVMQSASSRGTKLSTSDPVSIPYGQCSCGRPLSSSMVRARSLIEPMCRSPTPLLCGVKGVVCWSTMPNLLMKPSVESLTSSLPLSVRMTFGGLPATFCMRLMKRFMWTPASDLLLRRATMP
eukprot:366143-Chlamydomonas_euryale.AAC.5